MTDFYLLMSVVYLFLIAVWMWMEKRKHRARIWMGFFAIASAAPFFTAVGALIATFDTNMCYSGVVAKVADLPGTRNPASSAAPVASLSSRLPLRGYETDCNELNAAVDALKR